MFGERAVGGTGLDAHDLNALLADLVVQGLGVPLDRVLGRDVDRHERVGDEAGHGRRLRGRHAHGGRGTDQRRLLRALRVQRGPGRDRGVRPAARPARATRGRRTRPRRGGADRPRPPLLRAPRQPGGGLPLRGTARRDRPVRDPTRQAYTDSVLAITDDFAARLAPHDPQSVRTTVLSVYALMVGTLQLSRTLTDRRLADDLLEQGIRNALAVLEGEGATSGTWPVLHSLPRNGKPVTTGAVRRTRPTSAAAFPSPPSSPARRGDRRRSARSPRTSR